MRTFFVTEYQDTKLDGGRDGLGLLPLWSAVARRCILNVTSISDDLAGWRSLLVSAWLAERLVGDTQANKRRPLMEAAERLIAVARVHASNSPDKRHAGLRGGTRVTKLTGPVHVSGPHCMTLLKGQSATGIVGQIGRPAIRSGLLTEELRLTEEARTHLDKHLGELENHWASLRAWLIDGQAFDAESPPEALDVLARLCAPSPKDEAESSWLRRHVLYAARGKDTKAIWRVGLQRTLAEGIAGLAASQEGLTTRELVLHLERALPDSKDGRAVKKWLRDIQALEALLGRMDDLFGWLRCATSQSTSRDDIARAIHTQWEEHPTWSQLKRRDAEKALKLLRELPMPEALLDPFKGFARAIYRKPGQPDAMACVDAVLERNQAVVHARGRSPWLVSTGSQLQANITTQKKSLSFQDDWIHGFYLPQLRNLITDCQRVQDSGRAS